jgi:preprotein translocase subunit SecA
MAKGFLSRLFGDRNDREIARLQKVVQQINALEPRFAALTDADLSAETAALRERLLDDESLDDLLPEAFAIVREAANAPSACPLRRAVDRRHDPARGQSRRNAHR